VSVKADKDLKRPNAPVKTKKRQQISARFCFDKLCVDSIYYLFLYPETHSTLTLGSNAFYAIDLP